MCGRFAIGADPEEIGFRFDVEVPELTPAPRWNIAPTDSAPIILNEGDGRRMLSAKWGFPFPSRKGLAINARVESVTSKWMFRSAAMWNRCLIPATGWYEWTQSRDGKDPHHINTTERIIALAGLWESDEQGRRFTIITRPAIESIADIHNRMPLVITESEWDSWLNPNDSTAASRSEVMDSSQSFTFSSRRVGREVNRSTAEGVHLQQRLDSPE
jgi:putative SOS response-associated peptidase YedK